MKQLGAVNETQPLDETDTLLDGSVPGLLSFVVLAASLLLLAF